MKTIGLLGGMSWESTIPNYRQINPTIRARLGSLHSAKIVLYSMDFGKIESLQRPGDWQAAGALLAAATQAIERAGADFLVLCTNTMHKVAPAIELAVTILGCTEISLLVSPEDSPLPLFDTTTLHARYAAEQALTSSHQ